MSAVPSVPIPAGAFSCPALRRSALPRLAAEQLDLRQISTLLGSFSGGFASASVSNPFTWYVDIHADTGRPSLSLC